MKKNIKMLKVFFKVIKGNTKETNLILPNSYKKSIKDIDYKKLKKMGIKNLLFDIDNTIMPVNTIFINKDLKDFFKKLKKDFNICLISNNNLKRVFPVLTELEVNGISSANKPNKNGFDRALKIIKGNIKETAIIGDQMLTDIYGGKKYGLYTILVEPFKRKYDLKTGINRILQNLLLKRMKKITRYKYY